MAEPSPAPIVTGVPDTRAVPLPLLAGQYAAVVDSLRRILPDGEDRRVTVAAFNSSI